MLRNEREDNDPRHPRAVCNFNLKYSLRIPDIRREAEPFFQDLNSFTIKILYLLRREYRTCWMLEVMSCYGSWSMCFQAHAQSPMKLALQYPNYTRGCIIRLYNSKVVPHFMTKRSRPIPSSVKVRHRQSLILEPLSLVYPLSRLSSLIYIFYRKLGKSKVIVIVVPSFTLLSSVSGKRCSKGPLHFTINKL